MQVWKFNVKKLFPVLRQIEHSGEVEFKTK